MSLFSIDSITSHFPLWIRRQEVREPEALKKTTEDNKEGEAATKAAAKVISVDTAIVVVLSEREDICFNVKRIILENTNSTDDFSWWPTLFCFAADWRVPLNTAVSS